MQEQIIVSLTSHKPRLGNLPTILDTIYSQTIVPDKVVLNLAVDVSLPNAVADYLDEHHVEVYRVPDTKVYKKLLHTLKRYPNDIVISIDDDFLYPSGMIEDFLSMHQRHPNHPISGNRDVFYGMKCHCGCASLTMAKYFGEYLYQIDDEIIENCPSDDMVYTFFATKAGFPYLQTDNEYYLNMPQCRLDNDSGYSNAMVGDLGIKHTFNYLVGRYGEIKDVFALYIHDDDVSKVVENIQQNIIWETERTIRSSRAYRFGKFLLRPFSWAKKRVDQ